MSGSILSLSSRIKMRRSALTLVVLGVTTTFFMNEAQGFGGSSKPVNQIVNEAQSSINNLQALAADSPQLAGVGFDPNMKIDFNRDGVMDRLVCHPSELYVSVYDGTNLKNRLYHWAGPDVKTLADGSRRYFTGCSVAEIKPGYPSIFVSSAFAHPTAGMRVRTNQFVIHHTADVVRVNEVKFSESERYTASARSVKCVEYPKRLVGAGYKAGALCFYAGYDNGIPNGYGTNTALLKFEDAGASYLVKDITASSGLPWSGGARGTPMGAFPVRAGKYDGLHMMDSALVDFDKDGLVDLVTAGQHASLRFSRMIEDRARAEGIRFATTNITTASTSEMTEYLKLTAFDEHQPHLNQLACFFGSGEDEGAARSVPSHFRCYENGNWVRYDLPGAKFFSWGAQTVIKPNGKGRIVIRAKSIRKVSGKDVVEDKYFGFDHVGPIRSWVSYADKAPNFEVFGWACQANTEDPIEFIVQSAPMTAAQKKVYFRQDAQNELGQRAKDICLQTTSVGARFKAVIPKSQLEGSNIYVFARNKKTGETKHIKTIAR